MPTLNKLLTDGSISIGVSYKKTDESDYKWLQVTASNYEWLRVRLQVTTSHYISDYKWLRGRLWVTTSAYKGLQVTMNQERNTTGSQMISYNCRQETSSNH